MADKYKIIDDVYNHPIIGYGSIKSVYKEAKSINKNITVNDVKNYNLDKFSSNIKVIIHL